MVATCDSDAILLGDPLHDKKRMIDEKYEQFLFVRYLVFNGRTGHVGRKMSA